MVFEVFPNYTVTEVVEKYVLYITIDQEKDLIFNFLAEVLQVAKDL